MQYVLIIITYVWGGAAVNTQEFQSKERCEVAKDAITATKNAEFKIFHVNCVQK